MKKVIERIVESPGAPNENDLWLNGTTLKKFQNGQWVTISGGNSGGGGDSDSDIQIVELTYDHLPATGTLSASDLAKLDSDNCLLIINGKYFYKTFSANIGFDYHEIGLTTVLGGVRSIYFTASKPDGEYTIAYTYPVEANTQTQATTALENIKVGNTTYSVPLSPMIVNGELDDDDMFFPNPGSVSITEAYQHFANGGTVMIGVGDAMYSIISAERRDQVLILQFGGLNTYSWVYVEPVYVHGTVYPGQGVGGGDTFIADDITDSGYSTYNDMYNAVRNMALGGNEIPLYISYEDEHGETVNDHVIGYTSDFHYVYTDEGNIQWIDEES